MDRLLLQNGAKIKIVNLEKFRAGESVLAKFKKYIAGWKDDLVTASKSSELASSNSYAIGFGVGVSGGSVGDAAQLAYVLSRVVPSGTKPTQDQMAKAVGMLGGGVSEAIVIDTLMRQK